MVAEGRLRRVLSLAGWGLALGLMLVIWRFPDRILALRQGDAPVQHAPCDLATGPCTAVFPDGLQVRLSTEPPGLAPAQPILWEVETRLDARVEALDISGVSMGMGVVTVALSPAGPGRSRGSASLPLCTSERMLWRAQVRVRFQEELRVAAFEFWSLSGAGAAPPADPTPMRGAGAPDAPLAQHGDLHLDTASGPLSLSALQGQVVVVYFGYTACPDFCPTTLATIGAAFRALPEADQARVSGLMISLDPARDSLERLATYASHFHPRIRAGTAADAELERMTADWGVRWRQVPLEGSGLSYAIDHSTDAYLVGSDGRYLRSLPHGMPPEEMAQALREALPAP